MIKTHELTALLTQMPADRRAISVEGHAVRTDGGWAKAHATPGWFLPVASASAKTAEARSARPSQRLSVVARFGDAVERAVTERIERLARDIEAANRPYAPSRPPRMKSAGDFLQSLLQRVFIFSRAKQGVTVAVESLAHLRGYLDVQAGASDGIISGRQS
jgi:hypothetical protein